MNVSDLKILAKSLDFKEKQDTGETGWFSAYKTENDVLIRLSDHRVKLRTILNNNKPNLPKHIISIVCLCGNEKVDNQKNDTSLPQNVDFYVTQYEYDFSCITDTKDLISIQNDIKIAFSNGSYPNNELPISKLKPSPLYVTKPDSKWINALTKKINKRKGSIVYESFKDYVLSFEDFTRLNEAKANYNKEFATENRKYKWNIAYPYKVIGNNIEFEIAPNNKVRSIVSLSNGFGVCHICEDDHCYVLYQGSAEHNEYFRLATHIFPEVFDVLKDLPQLNYPKSIIN